MARFMLLYRAPRSAAEEMAGATPEQAESGMDAWMRWADEAGDHLLDLGAPLNEATRVGPHGEPDADHIAGYSFVQAESADELKGLLERHPHLHMDGAAIQVLEQLPMPGA